MNRTRALLGFFGVVAFVVGVLTVFTPGVAAAIPIGGLVSTIGGPWVFVASFGVLCVAVVVAVLLARGVEGIDESTPPDPEEVYQVPHPGERFDAFVENGVGVRERLFGDRHQQARQRVTQAALATLERNGMSRKEAKEALLSGSWTDDTAAAAFLSSRRTPDLGERLVAVFRGESTFQHGARRAAEEVARIDGGAR